MPLIVQKFGGTSVGSLVCIERVAKTVATTRALGHQVVVVVSAMAGETDRLLQQAKTFTEQPSTRELDMLLSTGETVSASLLAIALQACGISAHSLTGAQAGILTTEAHRRAHIQHINTNKICELLAQGIVPVVTGFQGVNALGEVTTLERGGSDTSAVAIAAALQAEECQIYTDVMGVYTADPRLVPEARLLAQLSYTEMLALSRLGAKVLHRQAVSFAQHCHLPLRILSSFKDAEGTIISAERQNAAPRVAGIASDAHQSQFSVLSIPNSAASHEAVEKALSSARFELDANIQTYRATDPCVDCVFTAHDEDYDSAALFANTLGHTLQACTVKIDRGRAKLSLIGSGMRAHPGFSAVILETLNKAEIPIYLITSTEAKISAILDKIHVEKATRLLHEAFALGETRIETNDGSRVSTLLP